MESRTRYVFITGGVVSSLGKGVTAASLGRLLKCRGMKMAVVKLDPYINVDPGTMSPFQHGEVFVTEDGAETDLDLGHYERFIDENTSRLVERDGRRDLRPRDPQGAPRRLPRLDGAGDPAHHRRDQAPHPARLRGVRRRHRARRDRRHGRRHRVPAVPRGDPPAAQPGRPRPRRLRPRDAGADDRGRRRAEDEADAALRQRAAPHRYHARRRRLPVRAAAVARAARQDRAVRRPRHRGRRSPREDADEHLPRPARAARAGLDDFVLRALRPRRAAARPRGVGASWPIASTRSRARPDRHRRQVRAAAGRLHVGRRGAAPRRHPPRRTRSTSTSSTPRPRRGPRSRAPRPAPTAS